MFNIQKINNTTIDKTTLITISVISLVLILTFVHSIFESLDSKEVMIIQYPNGTLKAVTEPGIYAQWFGDVTKYPLRSQFSFSAASDQGSDENESIKIRFNDGGHANVSGVVSWEMPIDIDNLKNIHRKFGSTIAIEQQLIRTAIETAVFTTGPLMSSTESAAEKRNDLQQYIQDQAISGPYKTHIVTTKAIDPLSGQEKTVNIAEIVISSDGKIIRENTSNLIEFGVKLLPLTINSVDYEKSIEDQISNRQKAIQSIQQAQADALKAEQNAITAAKTGEAAAATAKWEQEALKAKDVTKAQQEKEVATLNAQQALDVATLEAKSAEQYKLKQILEGQGDAEKQRLVMAANGALNQKLDAWVTVQKAYAAAIGSYTGAWVPQIVSGGNSQAGGNGANQLVDLLTAKSAKDLAIDLTIDNKK